MYLNEGRLFLIEVAVAGDTLRRQTGEIALAKRATYTPLLAHLYAHSGWIVLVFGHRGIIHPAALAGLRSILTTLGLGQTKRDAAKLATRMLQADSSLCVSDAVSILHMRMGHPVHGFVHSP